MKVKCNIVDIVENRSEKELDDFIEKEEKSFKKPVSTCYGITNKCEDGQYILFADYDKVYFGTLLKELDNIFNKFKRYLTPFAILESSESVLTKNGTLGSYHVVSFVKLPYQKMRELLSYMTVDDDFYKLPKNTPYRANTLRVSPKFAWETQYDAKTDEAVGNKQILKDAPRFITWYPQESAHIPLMEVSEAHLKTYKHLIEDFKFPLIYCRWIMDGSSKVEFKQYDSLGR